MKHTFNLVLPTVGETSEHSKLLNITNAIFLAGPCPRGDDEWDWRKDAFEYLDKQKFDGTVISPTNRFYDEKDPSYLKKQTAWEHEAMCKASAIVFWIPRSDEHPGLTTNIEFGEWLGKEGIFVGMPKDSTHNDYLKLRLDMLENEWFETLEKTLDEALSKINFKPKKDEVIGVETYFTSDTHFGQKRTLELSRRPFVNVKEMDLALISNWNKHVTVKDDVVHAGDVGDLDNLLDTLSCLNFRILTIVPGNYERDEMDKFLEKIAIWNEEHSNIFVEEDGYDFEYKDVKYHVMHEPICQIRSGDRDNSNVITQDEDVVYLFGHIHGRAFAKKNGFDLGTDYHRFTPISLDDVTWFNTARAKYWDFNVFCPKAKIEFIED